MELSPPQAWDLQAEVVAQIAGQRASWVPLAGRLADFHAGKGWIPLGHDSFNEWLGQPEISLGRGEAYAMIGAWRLLVEEHSIDPELLGRLDISKVAVILPAVRGGADVGEALGACETLSRSDLRAQYQASEHAEYRVCETCGSRVKVGA